MSTKNMSKNNTNYSKGVLLIKMLPIVVEMKLTKKSISSSGWIIFILYLSSVLWPNKPIDIHSKVNTCTWVGTGQQIPPDIQIA